MCRHTTGYVLALGVVVLVGCGGGSESDASGNDTVVDQGLMDTSTPGDDVPDAPDVDTQKVIEPNADVLDCSGYSNSFDPECGPCEYELAYWCSSKGNVCFCGDNWCGDAVFHFSTVDHYCPDGTTCVEEYPGGKCQPIAFAEDVIEVVEDVELPVEDSQEVDVPHNPCGPYPECGIAEGENCPAPFCIEYNGAQCCVEQCFEECPPGFVCAETKFQGDIIFFCRPVCQVAWYCDDQDPCTVDTCDPASGLCGHEFVNCCDGDPCTLDHCDPENGCVSKAPYCDSSGPCEVETFDPKTGECVVVPPPNCDDNDLCTIDYCDPVSGECINDPVDCNDMNCCTVDSCDPATGQCTHWPIDYCECNACETEVWVYEGTNCYLTCEPKDCDDNNQCTTDSCDPEDLDGDPCQLEPVECPGDNDLCTEDICDPLTGWCSYLQKDCGDGDLCTDDSCDPAIGCVNPPAKVLCCEPCIEPPICDEVTGVAKCLVGDCVFEATNGIECWSEPIDCHDGNLCTYDICDPDTSKCVNQVVVCEDYNPCTVDSCNPDTGMCEWDPVDCDEGDTCTLDACDPLTGNCTHQPIANCDLCKKYSLDQEACECLAEPKCDDGSWWTEDLCDPATDQCSFNALCDWEDTTCDDENLCTNDCLKPDGTCFHPEIECDDDDPCSIDTCYPTAGCVFEYLICDDGNLCTIEICDPNTGMVFYEPVDCDDGIDCTSDYCDSDTGACVQMYDDCPPCPEDGDCNDTDLCTVDQCLDDHCVNAPLDCDDGDCFTEDNCDPAVGCVHTPIEIPCP